MQVERRKPIDLSICGRSGERVSNAWVTCPEDRDNIPKGMLIPDKLLDTEVTERKAEALQDGPASY